MVRAHVAYVERREKEIVSGSEDARILGETFIEEGNFNPLSKDRGPRYEGDTIFPLLSFSFFF